MKPEYKYRAKVMRIYDADTIFLDIDLGCGVHITGNNGKGEGVRLARIDAWEVRGGERDKGLVARDFVRDEFPTGADVVIETTLDKTGKYGRLIAEVWYYKDDVPTAWVNLSDVLVALGHAKYVEY